MKPIDPKGLMTEKRKNHNDLQYIHQTSAWYICLPQVSIHCSLHSKYMVEQGLHFCTCELHSLPSLSSAKAQIFREGKLMVPLPPEGFEGFSTLIWFEGLEEILILIPYISQTNASNFDTRAAARFSNIPSCEKVST